MNKKLYFLIFLQCILIVLILFSITSFLYEDISLYGMVLIPNFLTGIIVLTGAKNKLYGTFLLLLVWIITWLGFINLNKKYLETHKIKEDKNTKSNKFLIFLKLIISTTILFSISYLLYQEVALCTYMLSGDFAGDSAKFKNIITEEVVYKAIKSELLWLLLYLIIWVVNWFYFINLTMKYLYSSNQRK